MKWWHRLRHEAGAVKGSLQRALAGPGPERDMGVQALKAAGAALIAWLLAGWWWQAPMALMAPWTAIALVQSTVYRSVRAGVQQLALITSGTLIAAAAVSVTHSTTAAIALALPLTTLLGNYTRFGEQGLYASSTALFVLTYGTYSATDIGHRLMESLLGAVVGIVVNALVLPPVHLRGVRDVLPGPPRQAARLARLMADDLEAGHGSDHAQQWKAQSDRLTQALADLRSARSWTQESLRFNPGHRLRRPPGALPAPAWDTSWERIAHHLSSLAGLLAEGTRDEPALAAPPTDVPARAAQLLRAVADVCDGNVLNLTEPWHEQDDGIEEATQRARDALEQLKLFLLAQDDRETEAVVGALVARAQQLIHDLSHLNQPSTSTETSLRQ
ncbi:aromatic acid exporter family protein [Streptomyces sp. NPDC001828]|uniref:FUSC family protein n=1 Tax=Streptomyces sp. NPDC001828 TaxID=3364615 RepID=UPI00367E05AC